MDETRGCAVCEFMNFHYRWYWDGPLVIGTAMNTAGQPVAIAMNLWWSQYAREPKSARPYILRRLLGETWLHPDAIFQILQVEHSMAEEKQHFVIIYI